MAEALGKKLVAEIDEVGFDEILQQIRYREDSSTEVFGLSTLDRLLNITTQSRSSNTKTYPALPILELTSLASGDGKTHLLYDLTARAVSPGSREPVKQACVVIIDTDGSLSVPRLAQQIQVQIQNQSSTYLSKEQIDETLLSTLKHVHIFRPQSLASTTATLHSLPDYLFNANRHHSFDRTVAFIALDSASTFYWQDRAADELATLLPSTNATGTNTSKSQANPTGFAVLSAALKSASQTFSCPAIYTSWHLGTGFAPSHNTSQWHEVRNLRPTLPFSLSQLATLRLIVRSVHVKKFPAGISAEEARREAPNRRKAVDEGRFECVVNEWGLDERTLQRLRDAGGSGFGFRIGLDGVRMEEGDGDGNGNGDGDGDRSVREESQED